MHLIHLADIHQQLALDVGVAIGLKSNSAQILEKHWNPTTVHMQSTQIRIWVPWTQSPCVFGLWRLVLDLWKVHELQYSLHP